MATSWRSRVVAAIAAGPGQEPVAVGGEERGGDEDHRVVAVRDASTIAAIAAASPTTRRWISCSECMRRASQMRR